MPYLDKDQKFYDYKTKEFDGVHPFDETKTGVSFYNQLLTDPDYMIQNKNLVGKIDYMSPIKYFEECGKIFNSSKEVQIQQTSRDTKTLKHLEDVLLVYKKTFPLTFLNYAENTQEGRHRMYVVGDLLGWENKYPVLLVNWADPVKEQEKQNARIEARKKNLEDVLDNCISETNLSLLETIDEYINELKNNLKYKGYDSNIEYNSNTGEVTIRIDSFTLVRNIYDFDILDLFDYDDLV